MADLHPELEQTHALADGELEGDALERAQDHLATCERCQAELSDLMQMAALPKPAANVISLAWYRRRSVQVAGVIAVAAAAATLLYLGRGVTATHDPVSVPKLALAEKRPIEARLSWQGASDYRVYSVQRGSTIAKEPISLGAMADLEKAGDNHGVAALAILGGDYEQSKKYIALAGETPDVLADRAALELQTGQPAKALAFADSALQKAPDATVATWNRALALRDLGLRHDAAEAFRIVAKRAEPGWAAEAAQRADALEKEFVDELELMKRVFGGAKQLALTQAGVAIDDAKRLPGVARVELYDALRSAPTAEAIAKLRPLAEAIDGATNDTSTVAALDRAKPDPIAAKAYLTLITEDKPDFKKVLGVLRAQKANDALVVAMLKASPTSLVSDADLPDLAKIAAASADVWIRLIGLEQAGANALGRDDLPKAEAVLLQGRELCKANAPTFRCMKVSLLLGKLYLEWQRLPEARDALADAWTRARALAQWEQHDILETMTNLAVVADTGGGLPLVRAYTTELAARAEIEQAQGFRDNACDVAAWGHERVAVALWDGMRTDEAIAQLSLAKPCATSYRDIAAQLQPLFIHSEMIHLESDPAALDELRKQIAKLRAQKLPAKELAFLDHIEGRALINTDAKAGAAALVKSIEEAKRAPRGIDSTHARGMSYAVLALTDAKRGDAVGALAVLADELGVTARNTCTLGIVLDDRDVALIARGQDEKTEIALLSRSSPEIDASTIVPAKIISMLKLCADVDVLARPPFHGQSRLLPQELAWRYVSARSRPIGPSSGASVVVANVQPPASLGLPALTSWQQGMPTLSGAAATPSRVLAAVATASDVVIDAHGI
ncbi:MAG TPA: zf-HC2 domain-containing protein, partial [Kofleriaceae bacterium]